MIPRGENGCQGGAQCVQNKTLKSIKPLIFWQAGPNKRGLISVCAAGGQGITAILESADS